MAISFRLPTSTTPEALEGAWLSVIARHGALRTAFSRSTSEELLLHEIEVLPGHWREHDLGPRRTREVVRDIFDSGCAPFQSPSHLVCLLDPDAPDETGDSRPIALLGSDHSHVDMWSVVVLARDLLAALDEGTTGPTSPGDPRPDPPAFAEHTAQLEAAPPAPDQIQTRWADILAASGGTMPTFPLPLGRLDPPPEEVVEVHDLLDAQQWDRFERVARHRESRPATLAVSALTRATLDLTGSPLRAVFPVHSRHEARWHESVGWFITNAVLECLDTDLESCRTAIREAMDLGSYPLAPLLAPYGGMPEGPGMFAVSWLDVRRLPVTLEESTRAQYVSAVIRTDGVMVWFVVTAAGMHLRCRYPDTPQARDSLRSWLGAVTGELQALIADEPHQELP